MSAPSFPATPYETAAPVPAPYDTAATDTVELPRPARPVADRWSTGLVLNATRLWTGGLATAAVAALVALVGTLVIRVLFGYLPVGAVTARVFDPAAAGLLCLLAAVAALAATGVAHLLLVSTPEPLSYLGWILGLSTAAAVVVPLLGTLPIAVAMATAVLNLVIGLAIGNLIVNTAGAAFRPAGR